MSDAVSRLLDRLEAALLAMPAHRYWIAYSGGIDSHVLLHAAATLSPQLKGSVNAVHVNHGLNPASSQWAAHCVATCDALDVPSHIFSVNAKPDKGESPEAAARVARYDAFAQLIEAGDCLLTAHHQEDQAETLLLQLLRGAGPHGLAAMPRHVPFAKGSLGRPMLAFSQQAIEQYASDKLLHWIEDPSNRETDFERNYLRHEVIPKLKSHWPAYAKTVARSAAHCAEAAGLLDQLAADDLVTVSGNEQSVSDSLPLHKLQQISGERRRNLLRLWLRSLNLPIVSKAVMGEIESTLIAAREDASPLVSWPGGEMRRYRDRLYAMTPLDPLDELTVIPWQWQQPLQLPAGLGRLGAAVSECVDRKSAGVNLDQCRALPMTIRFRGGGERCQLPGRAHRHALKGLMQEAGIPPWQRSRIPLIYLGEQLAAVVGHFYCEPFVAKTGESAVTFSID